MELELISEFREAENNAMLFLDVGEYPDSNAFESLGKYFHWYYFPNLDAFAPRKFIRYKRTSVEEYDSSGTGSDSSNKNMASWFHKIDREAAQYDMLLQKLKAQLNRLGKDLSDKTTSGTGGIYVPNSDLATIDYPDQISDENYFEGATKTVLVNAYERNQKARKECIAHYGVSCYSCGFDFASKYGSKLGAEFIHVHHVVDISTIGEEYDVNPIKDLRPLCPNCHAMVHKRKPAIHPDDLKRIIDSNA